MLTRYSLAAKLVDQYIRLSTLEFPYPANANIYWVGILRNFYNQGIAKALMKAANTYAIFKSANSMTVETFRPYRIRCALS
jgi:hypothetical protein